MTTMEETFPIDLSTCCQNCGACCGYSENWPRFSIESDGPLRSLWREVVWPERRFRALQSRGLLNWKARCAFTVGHSLAMML